MVMSIPIVPLALSKAQVTVTTIDGTPYRSDANGVIYVTAAHSTELQATQSATVITNTAGSKNTKLPNGAPLSFPRGNTP